MDYLYNLKIPLLRNPKYYNLSTTSSFSVEKSASCNHKSFVSKVINQGLLYYSFNTSQTSDNSVCLLSNILFALFMKLYFFVVFTLLFNKWPLPNFSTEKDDGVERLKYIGLRSNGILRLWCKGILGL